MSDITIPRKVAEQLYDLYNHVSAADAHFHRCQSDNFRVHIKSVYENKGVSDAFAALKAKLDEPENDNTPKKPSEARRGVLTDD